jgi:GTP-binding protein LepA
MYPADSSKYPDLRDALEKLQLNDAALQFEPETSLAYKNMSHGEQV